MTKRVAFCTPVVKRPTNANLDSLEASLPLIEQAGWEHFYVNEIGNPYISAARSNMLRKALEKDPNVIVFIDYDVSWKPQDLLTLIETEGDVVSGTYRFKKDEEEYMGKIYVEEDGKPTTREDGCIKSAFIPAGFLKITNFGVNKFAEAYPELIYGTKLRPFIDLFNHGAYQGLWYGEDYAFSRNWRDKCGDIWLIPNLDLDHNSDDKCYKGNFHEWLLKQPGGSKDPNRG